MTVQGEGEFGSARWSSGRSSGCSCPPSFGGLVRFLRLGKTFRSPKPRPGGRGDSICRKENGTAH